MLLMPNGRPWWKAQNPPLHYQPTQIGHSSCQKIYHYNPPLPLFENLNPCRIFVLENHFFLVTKKNYCIVGILKQINGVGMFSGFLKREMLESSPKKITNISPTVP